MAKKKPVKKTKNANRPGQYDWFKNGSDKSNGSTPKSSGKVIWKFVKIFLFISLFGFTITGCIQSMVFKTDSHVGRSVEMYANNDEVAPHTTTINVNSKNPKEIYLENTDSNHWINERENKNVLGHIRGVIKVQNKAKNLQLKDAWHGSNELLRLLDNMKQTDKANDSIIGGANPMVLSSEATTYGTNSNANIANVFNGVTIVDKTGKTLNTKVGTLKLEKNKHPDSHTIARDAFNTQLLTKVLGTKYNVKKALIFNANKASDQGEINRIMQNFKVITQIFHISYVEDKKTPANSYWEMQSNFMIGAGTSSLWRPLVTWGDSWKLGPFYAIFVWPVGYATANMIKIMPFMDGWESLITIFIIVFVIKALSFLITFKSILQQTKMQELSAKKAVIDAKYANYKDNKQMQQRKQQEVQALYKKEGISPLGSMGSMFIVMPLFFSILRVTYGLPHLKSTLWLGIRFGATSWKELFHGSWQYLPLMILAMTFAGVQQILPRLLTKRRDKNRMNVHQKAAMKKNNKIQNITIVVSIAASVIFSAGMQVYYLASGTWMIIQAFLTHHILVKQKQKRRTKKIKT